MLAKIMKIFCCLGLAAAISGCYIPATLKSAAALTDEDKEAALRERLEKFTRALYWGAAGETASFLAGSVRQTFIAEEARRRETERLVSSDVSSVVLGQDGNEAVVEMKVRYYEQPTYVVQTRREELKWRYDRFGGGWLVTGREDITNTAAVPVPPKPTARGKLQIEPPSATMR